MNPLDEQAQTIEATASDLSQGRPLTLMQRRRFIQAAAGATAGVAMGPTLFAGAAGAQTTGTDTILLTVTLGGGNDGLNTVGPFGDGTYQDLRRNLAIGAGSGHSVGEGHYFHPNLRRLATRYRRGDVAVIRGVGDPQLDHSHFSNLARWMSANPGGAITGTGWLGRWLDANASGPFTGIAIGGQGVPLHMRGTTADVTDLPRHGGGLYGSDRSEQRDQRMYRAIRQMGASDNRAPWVNRVGEVMAQSIDTAQSVAAGYPEELPEELLASDMVLAARVINLNLGTRVLNISQNGYDTHDNQVGASSTTGDHADLLEELDAGLDSFFATLTPAMAERVVVMIYSEFGRRAEPNGSRGTDHGTSNNVFLIGRRVKGGLFGDPPSLRSLDDRGDFKTTMDFRRVYSNVLEEGLGTSGQQVLGGTFGSSLGVFGEAQGTLQARADRLRALRREDPTDYLRGRAPTF